MMKTRKTNEERSTATRTRLLDATIACLVDLGYASTTTTEIAQRAGVSRGAQLHHYPTKAELVSAAVRHLFELRAEEFRSAFEALPRATDRISAAIDLLWSALSGPSYHASLELTVAARTDPELREQLEQVCRRMTADIIQMCSELVEAPAEQRPTLEVGGTLLFFALEGMSASKIVMEDGLPYSGVLDLLKSLARAGLPAANH